MNIIFLDIDGVLNSERYMRKYGSTGLVIDPLRLALVKRIVDETDAKIVLTTSWREHWDVDGDRCDSVGREINDVFGGAGLSIFDKTPLIDRNREKEIEQWLACNYPIDNFVVIDDCFLDSKTIRDHFVKTDNYRDGLGEDNTAEAIKILKCKM